MFSSICKAQDSVLLVSGVIESTAVASTAVGTRTNGSGTSNIE